MGEGEASTWGGEGGGLQVGGGVQQLGRNEDDWCGFLCDRKWRCCCKLEALEAA